MFYTYLWLREDGTPYYVGKGTARRAFSNTGRRIHRPIEKSRIFIQHWWSESVAFEMEKWYISFFGRKDIGTGILRNLTDGGEGPENLSEEIRNRMSLSHTGKKHLDETREKIRVANMGNKSRTGLPHSEKTKDKMRASITNAFPKGGIPWNKGKTFSEESIRKMSAAHKLLYRSDKVKGQLRAAGRKGNEVRSAKVIAGFEDTCLVP